MSKRNSIAACMVTLMVLGSPRAGGGQPHRVGGEFQVNSYTPGRQEDVAIAAEADGDFFVAWMSDLQDGDSLGVFGRRFASTGAPLASEFRLSTFTVGDQGYPAIAAQSAATTSWSGASSSTRGSVDDGGELVVVWRSYDQDGSSAGVRPSFRLGGDSPGCRVPGEQSHPAAPG